MLHVVRRLQRAVQEAYAAGHLGTDIHGSGFDLRRHRARRRRRVHLRRGDGAARLARGSARPTAAAPAVPGRRGSVRRARPSSTTSSRSPPCRRSCATAPSGSRPWAPRSARASTLYSLSGHVTRPGQYEAPLGITLRELLDLAGGVREGHELKFWTPGGSSTPMLTAEHLDVPLDYEAVGAAGSMLGTKALQIFDETTCVVRAVLRWTEFYKHESCGKCTPCREGTYWLVQTLAAPRARPGQGGRPRHAARPVRQHPRPVVLRARRRRDQPDHLVHPVLPRGVPRRTSTSGRLPLRPRSPSTLFAPEERVHDHFDSSTGGSSANGSVEQGRPRHADHRRHRGQRAQGHAGDPRRRAARHRRSRGSATTRCSTRSAPAASAWSRSPTPATAADAPSRRPRARSRSPPGMVVRTQLTSPVADKAQHGIMEMLLINHPLDCPVCDKGGECPLQNQAMTNGRGETRFTEAKRTFPKPIKVSAQVLLDRERCVLCARCTRFSEQIAGDPFIELIERGALQQVGIYERRAVRLLLLGQHDPDLPGRGADRAATASAPGRSTWSPPRRSCEHAPAAARSASTTAAARSCAGWPATTPRSTRSGSPTRTASRSRYATRERPAHPPAGPRRRTGELEPRPGRTPWRSPRAARRARRPAGRRADRRPAHRRGRLRLRQVRPHRARHQRHRLPGPRRTRPRRRRSSRPARRGDPRRRHLRRPREGRRRASWSGFEPEDEARHRVPAAAQGAPATARGSTPIAPLHVARPAKMAGTPDPHRRPAARPPPSSAVADGRGHRARRRGRHPGRRAAGHRRRARSPPRVAAGRDDRRPAGLGARAAPASAARVEAGCLPDLLPGGRPSSDAAARVDLGRRLGRRRLPVQAGSRHVGDPRRGRGRRRSAALVVGGVEPDDLPDPAAARAALDAVGFLVSLEVRASAVTERADVVLPVAPVAEKPGTFVNWEGRPRHVRARCCAELTR